VYTRIFGAGPIDQWLELKLAQADAEVTLPATELLEQSADFEAISRRAGLETPGLDALLACAPRATLNTDHKEVV
jgi:hypothetical protein